MMSSLNNLNCLITGASRGFGAQLAESFWEAGANLMLLARSQDDLGKIVQSLQKKTGQKVEFIAADLSKLSALDSIINETRKRFPSLDVLVNNAAVQGPVGRIWQNDWQAWQNSFQLNLFAPVALCRLCVPWMKEQYHGKIINISGGGGTGPRPNVSAYATAKAALIRFSETLAEETREFGLDVNCIAPGAMNTSMMDMLMAAGRDAAGAKEYEQARNVRDQGGSDPARAAALCVYLASRASDGITGKIISAIWDPWEAFHEHAADLRRTDVYTLRRIVPKDRGLAWGT